MFGQYIPIGLEPLAWRIVHRIRVVHFTLVKAEPPIQRTASKVYPLFYNKMCPVPNMTEPPCRNIQVAVHVRIVRKPNM